MDQINSFIDASRKIRDAPGLGAILEDFARDAGFRYFSLFQGSVGGRSDAARLTLSNYPEAWIERVRALRYHLDDPVFVASARTAVGFRVSDVAGMLQLTRRQRRTLEESRSAGLGDGFSIPSHVPGEAHGMCTFLTERGREPRDERLGVMQLAGCFAYEAGRRIRGGRTNGAAERTSLTDRQLECVVLIARGKTDWEMSRILGLAEDTVTEYVDDARRRYGAERRVQLVVRALVDGHLTLQDALH